MPIFWIVVYCLIAVGLLFALTFQDELRNEKQRCDKLGKSPTVHDGEKPEAKNLPHSA